MASCVQSDRSEGGLPEGLRDEKGSWARPVVCVGVHGALGLSTAVDSGNIMLGLDSSTAPSIGKKVSVGGHMHGSSKSRSSSSGKLSRFGAVMVGLVLFGLC